MLTLAYANLFIFLVVCGGCIFIGLDPRKWFSWLFGLYGFVSGFIFGLLKADTRGGIMLGALFALVVIYGGISSFWQRQRFK